MKQPLSTFLSDLFTTGEVTIAPNIKSIEETDQQQALSILQQFYERDRLEMPVEMPAFEEAAAMWAATYLYRTIQLIFIRQLGKGAIKAHLQPFPVSSSPAVLYAVDLTFRYLPDLFHLAKGLAPSDVLVTYLNQIAVAYPFSSVGIELKGAVDHTLILEHPALKIAYVDRLIAAKDIKRIQQYELQEYVEEVLGDYRAVLWADYEDKINPPLC